jgi:hypothetical protein
MAVKRGKKEPDMFERCARDRLEPVLGLLRQIDPGGGPVPLHDFEADLPGGLVAAVEVTSVTEPKRQALDQSPQPLGRAGRDGGSRSDVATTPTAALPAASR